MEKKKLCCAVILVMLPLFASAETSPPYEEAQNEKAYFLSSSIPEKILVTLMQSAEKNHVPVYFRGLISDSVEKTAKYIQYLSSKYGVSGVQIDPVRFSEYQINNVPAYVEKCGPNFDVVYGNVSIENSQMMIKKRGDCKSSS
ncbi:type-F conjugative transfer system pilin assembly protein TrbC [Klebsiella pneumoniae subsp. ozaenae]